MFTRNAVPDGLSVEALNAVVVEATPAGRNVPVKTDPAAAASVLLLPARNSACCSAVVTVMPLTAVSA
ncbi:hypothetical protein [Sphingomonas aurantiaca]|uniref:hypothetical protein n=1 Tax=Sphingomonas aurantiaca TaxID=185949 RepID=UPI002FDFF16C